jgi:hypothetical protein
MSDREFDAQDWHVATGTRSARFPYWVTRTVHTPGSLDRFAALNAKGNTRKFATKEAAQKVADKLQAEADIADAREHARLATHYLIRATDGLQPDDPKLTLLQQASDLYLALTGVK